MNWRQGVFFAAVALGLILGGRFIWQKRDALILNKALYLANQGETTAARQQLERIKPGSDTGAIRRARMAARLAMAEGRPGAALENLRGLDSPGAAFDRGVANYLSGHEELALADFGGALSDPEPLTADEIYLARLAEATLKGKPAPLAPVPTLSLHQPHRQLLLASLLGRANAQSAAWAAAGAQLDRAIALGDQTTPTRVAAVVAHGMLGQFSEAARRADGYIHDDAFLNAIQVMVAHETTSSAGLVEMDEVLRASADRTGAMRVATWASLRHAIASADSAAIFRAHELVRDAQSRNPGNRFLEMLEAEACEAAGMPREAFEIYGRIAMRDPNLATLVRMAELTGESNGVSPAVSDYLTSSNVVALSQGADFKSTAAETIGGYPTLTSGGTLETTVTIPAAGPYRLALVALGNPSAGIRPEIKVLVAGQPVADIYIARSGRDGYSAPVTLKAGPNTVGIEFANDAAAPVNPAEDRLVSVELIAILPAESR